MDSATGLYYNQARWYDPTLGRFISESPIAPFAEEEYVYCGNDPVNFVDFDGFWGVGIGDFNIGRGKPTYIIPLQPLSDYCAGFGDVLSFGITSWIREYMEIDTVVNKSSAIYNCREWSGIGYSIVLGGTSGVKAAGTKAAGNEFSHFIPARYGGPRSILNGNWVPTSRHALSDPYRYRFMPRTWKAANPLPNAPLQLWNRVPNTLIGTGAGATYGSASSLLNE